ncbi:MAG: FhaA domain-containing protein [Ilumatobacteraceae bacterium]
MQALERRLERMVDSVFRRSRSNIRPIELGRRLLREMDDQRNVDVRGERVAPNDFIVLLSADDHAGFADMATALTTELAEACREYARDEGYRFMGPVKIELRVDNGLKRGRFGIASSIRQGDPVVRPGAIVLPSGERIALTSDTNVIGRLTECAITIHDGNVSRRHAQIQRAGNVFTISDLGSTNGTFLNSERLTAEHRLTDGDIIAVGPVHLRFEASSAASDHSRP